MLLHNKISADILLLDPRAKNFSEFFHEDDRCGVILFYDLNWRLGYFYFNEPVEVPIRILRIVALSVVIEVS